MSVASVTNKTLQLAELVISNEKFTGATGYVASTSTFSSSVNGTSLSPQLSLTNGANSVALTPYTSPSSANFLSVPNLNISGVEITFGTQVNTPSIEVIGNALNIYGGGGGSSNNLTIHAGGVVITSPVGSGTLSVNSSGQLTWNTVVIS